MEFRWNAWNLDHATRHGVPTTEAERMVDNAGPPYPQAIEDRKRLVIGRGTGGRWLQVVYVLDADGTAYVIHARPVTDREKRRMRRRRR